MAWVAETANPEAWNVACFSNIVYESGHWVVYVGGDVVVKFYRYNLDTNAWTELTDPPAAFYNQLAVSPDGTKVVGHAVNGDRLYIYNISSPGWTTSSVCPAMPETDTPRIQSMAWADSDTVWCQIRAHTGTEWRVKFYKYTVSTDTWTQYTNYRVVVYGNSLGTCISTDGTKLYAGQCGTSYRYSTKYTIATDTYAAGPTLPLTYYFCYQASRNKLWFAPRLAGKGQIRRWLNPDTEVLEGNVFSEYAPGTAVGLAVGVYGLTMCIAGFMLAPPENLSETLASLPTVTTDAASSIDREEATLNGTLDADGGDACECGFEWGETDAYGNTTPTQSRTTGQTFAQTITGLDPGTLYHFRAFAVNPAGTSYGVDRTFTTLQVLPTVTTNSATSIEQTTVTLNGTLDEQGLEACDCSFEYGETTGYGSTTATQSKTPGETFSQEVRGLMSGRVNHFRAIDTNSAGTSYGADRTFHTEALSAKAHQALGKGYALGRHGL